MNSYYNSNSQARHSSTAKDFEEKLWLEFSDTGKLPVKEKCEEDAVHQLLQKKWNSLTKLIYGELLARDGKLVGEGEIQAHYEASCWVRGLICSKRKNYSKKNEMLNALDTFCQNSKNPRISFCAKLRTARNTIEGNKDSQTAEKYANRLITLAEEDASNVKLGEFIELSISVAWILYKKQKNETFLNLVQLLRITNTSSYLDENISTLKKCSNVLRQQGINGWNEKVKNMCTQDISPKEIKNLLEELLLLINQEAWKTFCAATPQEENFARKIALLRINQLVKKLKKSNDPEISPQHALLILKVFECDGLKSFPKECFERTKKENTTSDSQGNGEWPSLVEDIAKTIYISVKSCAKTRSMLITLPNLDWAIDFLTCVYSKFKDDQWGDFRIGKLLVWSGKMDDAKIKLLPCIRKNKTEAWAWDLMADLFPEERVACLVYALNCHGIDGQLEKIKKTLITLGYNEADTNREEELRQTAEYLLLDGLPVYNGILIKRYRNKDNEERYLFSDGRGSNIFPVSKSVVRKLDKNVTVGMPVKLYFETEPTKNDGTHLIAVKNRVGKDWDVLSPVRAFFLEEFRTKKDAKLSIFVNAKGEEMSVCETGKKLTPMELVDLYFEDVTKGGHSPECVHIHQYHQTTNYTQFTLPHKTAIYFGKSMKGTSLLFSSGTDEINVPINNADKLFTDIEIGDAFNLYFSMRKEKDGTLRRNVRYAQKTTPPQSLLCDYQGQARFPNGFDKPAFVEDTFVETSLYKPLVDKKSLKERHEDNIFFSGKAVRMPSKNGRTRMRAITIQEITESDLIFSAICKIKRNRS